MKFLTRTLVLLLVIAVAQGCSDILERTEPPTSISQEVALEDQGAIEGLRAGMYNHFHSFNYTTEFMLAPEALADNLQNRAGTSRFEDMTQNAVGSGVSSWGTAYNAIQKANLLLHGINEDALSQEQLTMFRGEAYFMRAFAMHHLARALGYEPGQIPATGSGAGWDRSIIIRTEPTTSVEDADLRTRSSITETYEQIKADLNQAIDLLSQSQESSRYFIQEAAAHALLARVHLYEGNYADAQAEASAAMNTSSASLVDTENGVEDMFNENTGANPEGIFIGFVEPATESQGVNSALNAYTAQQWIAMVPTQDLMDLYDEADWRNAWYAPCFNDVEGSPASGCPADVETQKWNGEKGNFADDVPYFRVAEMILIQAEAQLQQGNLTEALDRLNTLRNARGLGDFISVDSDAIMDEILDERRREFAAEGQRFFDLKRLGMDIRKAPETGLSVVRYTDFRILDNLPNSQIELNPDLQQNPGY